MVDTFWNTEYGKDLMSVRKSPIEVALDNPYVILEDLFEEDELLQQCSNKNTELMYFLSKADNIKKLISYITQPYTTHIQQLIVHYQSLEKVEKQKHTELKAKHNVNEPNPMSNVDVLVFSPGSGIPPPPPQGKLNKTNKIILKENKNTNINSEIETAKIKLEPNCTNARTIVISESSNEKNVLKECTKAFVSFTHSETAPINKNEEVFAKISGSKVGIPPPPSRVSEYESEIGIERVKRKFPYLASEIINCQIPSILDSILDLNKPYLKMLFDFIDQTIPLNAVLTNYWRSCIVGLVRRNSKNVLHYIKQRPNLLGSLVQHIRDQSIMELVIALGWDPAIEELQELDDVADWMYEQQLVPKLISTLSPFRSSDEHSAAAYTLVDIVAKTSRSTNLVLFEQLSSQTQIEALMEHMFLGNRSSLLESLSVLLALLHHYPNVNAEKVVEIPSAPHLSPEETEIQMHSLINSTADGFAKMKIDNIDNLDLDDTLNLKLNVHEKKNVPQSIPLNIKTNKAQKDVLNQSQSSRLCFENNTNIVTPNFKSLTFSPTAKEKKLNVIIQAPKESNVNNYKNFDRNFNKTHDDSNTPPVVRTVCSRLEDFKHLLLAVPNEVLKLPFVTLTPPLGPVRHKIVDMIVALMRTPSELVSQKLREFGFIQICIDLFFQYSWNNLLHGSVEHIVQMIVSGNCQILKCALFEDCNFLQRILEARKLSADHTEQKNFRLGYMGHLTRVANTIVEFAKHNSHLQQYMEKNAQWTEFINGDLKLDNEKLNTQLGGHRPTTLGTDEEGCSSLFNDSLQEEDLLDWNSSNDNENNEDERDDDNGNDNDKDHHLLVESNMKLNQLAALRMGVIVDKTSKQVVKVPHGHQLHNGFPKGVNNINNNYSLPTDDFDGFTKDLDNRQENNSKKVDVNNHIDDKEGKCSNKNTTEWSTFTEEEDDAWLEFDIQKEQIHSKKNQQQSTVAHIADFNDFFSSSDDFFFKERIDGKNKTHTDSKTKTTLANDPELVDNTKNNNI